MPNVLPTLLPLLKPGGFIGLTTWADLGWHPLLTRSIARLSPAPYSPSVADLSAKMFAGRDWGNQTYVAAQLSAAGFENVDTLREKRMAVCGSPRQFMQTMQMVMKFVGMFWEEGERERLVSEVSGLMLEEAVKDAGGEEGSVEIEFDGIVAWGWKRG